VCKEGVVPYDDAVNLFFLKSVSGIDAGTTAKIDYSANKTEVMASGNWSINFETGKSNIVGSDNIMQTIYGLLMQAEEAKLIVVGHTDNVGNAGQNVKLSKDRANAVVTYLTNLGISSDRFQTIDGVGSAKELVPNTSKANQAKNRRVEITLVK
jgi:outer membrane protein OmpA-like peptidoglycan-associated protein